MASCDDDRMKNSKGGSRVDEILDILDVGLQSTLEPDVSGESPCDDPALCSGQILMCDFCSAMFCTGCSDDVARPPFRCGMCYWNLVTSAAAELNISIHTVDEICHAFAERFV